MALITLTTDFGTQDPYVAQMKGVLYSEGPEATTVVDLSHDVPAHDIAAGARFLEAAVGRFPAGTVHVAVVDPTVGSARSAMVAVHDGQTVVAPDNGLASALLRCGATAYTVDVQRLNRPHISPTFHGRDVFAPVAARLAAGAHASHVGPPLVDPVVMPAQAPVFTGGGWTCQVIHIDRFGNAITNLTRADVHTAVPTQVQLDGGQTIALSDHYATVPVAHPIALFDSADRLEIAVREGCATEVLGLKPGNTLRVLFE